jgi:hypothetical protein
MSIRVSTDNDRNSWDSFVLSHNESSFFHTYVWGKILEEGGVGKRLYFVLEKNEEIVGIFPSFLVFKPVRHLRCLPLSDYGSPLLLFSGNKTVHFLRLLKYIQRRAFTLLTAYLSFRLPSFSSLRDVIRKDFTCKLTSYGIRLNTANKNADFIWKNLSKKRRNSIRKAIKTNLEIKECGTLKDFIDYYKIHICSMKRLNVPPMNFRIFKSIYENLRPRKDYLMLLAWEHSGVPVAGTLTFIFRNEMYLWGNVSHKEYWALNPNDLLYWNIIEYACEKGFKYVDFGPSPISRKGDYFFKIQFGGKEIPLYDYYYSHIPFLLTLKDIYTKLLQKS